MKSFTAPAVACLAVATLIATAAPAARAAPLSDCTSHHGTIVAVDFAHWGGPIVRGCGISQPSGYAMLHAAGFTTAGDQHDGPEFICRLGDKAFRNGTQYPTPREDACIVTPPLNAYWSYWVAPAGQNRWNYSPLGAMGDTPKSGEVELWTFGATNTGGTSGSGVPSVRPSTLRAPAAVTTTTSTTSTATTSTAPTTTTSTHPATTTTASTTTAGAKSSTPGSRPAGSEHRHVRLPARSPARPRARRPVHPHAPVLQRSRRPAHQTSRPAVVAAQPTRVRDSSGSALALVIGICLALALCGGAGWAAWRRRQYE